ncbi:hypothetical protein [Achromobacter xylosoxidans]|uniref:hypothetical protein n=1 Tax=Alcaligenes xylosoxydans xylosoxydans TaxID=85698 RepID=UPI003D0610B0
MLKPDTAKLFRSVASLLNFAQGLGDGNSYLISEDNRQDLKRSLRDAREQLELLQMTSALKATAILENLVDSGFLPAPASRFGAWASTDGWELKGNTPGKFADASKKLFDRTVEALEDVPVFAVRTDRKLYLREPAESIGSDVVKKFPSAVSELKSSTNCLAFEEPTAAVFHLLRALEIGIQALCKSLGLATSIAGRGQNWGALLTAIDNEIARRERAKPPIWTNLDARFFKEVRASLGLIKDAWRNPTMHVENSYDWNEAEHIFAIAKGLLRSISLKIDETGNPLA